MFFNTSGIIDVSSKTFKGEEDLHSFLQREGSSRGLERGNMFSHYFVGEVLTLPERCFQ